MLLLRQPGFSNGRLEARAPVLATDAIRAHGSAPSVSACAAAPCPLPFPFLTESVTDPRRFTP
jgi:hypothetical protein